ncbi:MAG: hypothetical protein VB934_20845, partial [Polyangiaceae bacterium]
MSGITTPGMISADMSPCMSMRMVLCPSSLMALGSKLEDLQLDTSEHAEQLELTLRLRHQNGDTLRLALRIDKLDRLDEARDFFIRLVTPLASRTAGYRSAHKR